MKLNVDKCAVLRCTRSQTPIQYVYTLIDCNLHVKKLHTYLGVEIDNTMSWSPHIQTVSNRATKVFNFVKRNLGNCPASTKRIAYLTLVRPIMEYAAPVWDPFYNTDIYKLEKIQRRAARWITSDYSRHISVASLLSSLNTPTLQHRRNSSRLSLFYSIVNNLLPINIPHTTKELNSIPETIIQPTLFCLKHPLIVLSTVFIQELSEIGITCQLISLNQGTWKNLLIYLTNYS